MIKIIVFIALAFFVVNAERYGDLNWTGYGDTCTITAFRADSLKYSRARALSAYENLRIDVWAQDTSSAGYASDSISFTWGIQVGHAYDSVGTRCTLWLRPRMLADSFRLATAIKKDTFTIVDTNGLFWVYKNVVDTSKTDYARQSANLTPNWDVLFRTWYKGATGNKINRFLVVKDVVLRRKAANTKDNN